MVIILVSCRPVGGRVSWALWKVRQLVARGQLVAACLGRGGKSASWWLVDSWWPRAWAWWYVRTVGGRVSWALWKVRQLVVHWTVGGSRTVGGLLDLEFWLESFLVTLPQIFCMGKILWLCM